MRVFIYVAGVFEGKNNNIKKGSQNNVQSENLERGWGSLLNNNKVD